MTGSTLEILERQTADQTDATVIWLHGLGASGDDFVPIVPELGLGRSSPGVRFVFPHAPVRPITINNGFEMRGWYDITSLDFDGRDHDDTGMADSVSRVLALVEQELAAGVRADKVILAGFSQGGAVALQAGLLGPHTLGGIMALSTYLPPSAHALDDLMDTRRQMPIFMAHGQFDDVIAIRHAQASRDRLETAGLTVQWQDYPMPHSVSPQEVGHIGDWLRMVLDR